MKKLSKLCLTFALLSVFIFNSMNVQASDNGDSKGKGPVTSASASGKIVGEARGKYLMDGECSITKAGRGKVYVYASSTANQDVDFISVTLFVEKLNASGSWEVIDRWQVRKSHTYYVATSRMLSVDRGSYYRVRAVHIAGIDAEYPYNASASVTDGIYLD